jgi:hypothetical protein
MNKINFRLLSQVDYSGSTQSLITARLVTLRDFAYHCHFFISLLHGVKGLNVCDKNYSLTCG